MCQQKKQTLINMIAQIISFVISMGISFFLTPIIIKTVGKEAYGFVGLANNFVSYISIIVSALNSMTSRYITIHIHRNEYEEANKYFTTVLFSNVLISILLIAPITLIICRLHKIIQVPTNISIDVKILWGLIFGNFIIDLITSIYGSCTYVQNRLDISAKRTIESKVLKVIVLLILFSLFKPHIFYVGIASFISCIYCAVFSMYYTTKLLPQIKIRRKYFDFYKIIELVSAGIWNSIGKISSVLTDGLDLLIVNLFIGSAAMGSVSVAKTVPSLILSVFGMLAGVFMPQLNISYAKNDFDDMKQQVTSSIKMLGMVACIPVSCLYAYGDIFFSLWTPSEDSTLLHWLAIASAAEFPFILMLEPIWNVFTVTNKIKYSTLFLIANSFAGIILTLISLRFVNDLTMKMFVVVGISSLLAIVRAWTFMPMYSAKCMRMKAVEFYKPIIKNTVALAVVTTLSIGVRCAFEINTWLKLIFAFLITGMIALTINCRIILTAKERMLLKNKILRR